MNEEKLDSIIEAVERTNALLLELVESIRPRYPDGTVAPPIASLLADSATALHEIAKSTESAAWGARTLADEGRKRLPPEAGGDPINYPREANEVPLCEVHLVDMAKSKYRSDSGQPFYYCQQKAAEDEAANQKGYCPCRAYIEEDGSTTFWQPKP